MRHAPLSWFLTTSADWGLRHPRACCSPISDSRFTAFGVVPTDRSHLALRLPDIRATEVTGTRWDTGGTPAVFRTLRRRAPRRQQPRLTTLACLLAVHRPNGPDAVVLGNTTTWCRGPNASAHPASHPVRRADIAA
jgi:hypothetical protein